MSNKKGTMPAYRKIIKLIAIGLLLLPALLLRAGPVSAAPPTNTCTWLGGTGNWSEKSNWSGCNNQVPGSGDLAIINAGEAILTKNEDVGHLQLNGGMISGNYNLTVVDTITWAGGTLKGSGTLSAVSLAINGTGTRLLETRNLTVSGITAWDMGAGGTLDLSNPTAAASYGVMSLNGGGEIRGRINLLDLQTKLRFGGGTFTLYNNSSLYGSGVVEFSGGTSAVNGRYTLDVNGRSVFSGGSVTFNALPVSPSLGDATVSGATVTLATGSPFGIRNLTISSGTLTGVDYIYVFNTLTWSGGTISGSGTPLPLLQASSVSITSSAQKTLSARDLGINGVTTWTSTGSLHLNNGAALQNQVSSTFNVTSSGATLFTTSSGTAGSFTNQGLFDIQISGTTAISVPVTNNSYSRVSVSSPGTLSLTGSSNLGGYIDVNGTLDLNGGTHALTGDLNGTGTVRVSSGTVNVTQIFSLTGPSSASEFAGGETTFTGYHTLNLGSTVQVSGNAILALSRSVTPVIPVLNMTGGTLTGTSPIHVSQLLTWTGGTITKSSGTPDISTALLTISGNGGKALTSRTLVAIGTTSTSGTGTLSLTSSTLSLAAGGTLNSPVNVGSGSTLEFSGITLLTLGASSSISGQGEVIFNGPVQVNGSYSLSGTTSRSTFYSGSDTTFNTMSAAPNLGNLVIIYGSLVLSSTQPVTIPNLDLNGGTLSGADTITVSGTVNWNGGTLARTNTSASLNVSGTFNYLSTSPLSLNRALNLTGPVAWTGSGVLSVNPQGDLNFSHDPVITVSIPNLTLSGGILRGSDPIQITNTLTWSSGDVQGNGTLSVTTLTFNGISTTRRLSQRAMTVSGATTWNNTTTGTLTLRSNSTLNLNGGGMIEGTITIESGSTLRFGGSSAFTLGSSSNLSGAGTVEFNPGVSTSIGINGSYNLTGSSLFTSGSISFSANPAAIALGANVTISGAALNLSSGYIVTMTNLTMSGGTLTGSDQVNIAQLAWSGGTISRSGTVDPPNPVNVTTLNVSGSADKTLNIRNLAVSGTTTWTSTGALLINNGAILSNLVGGTFTINSCGSLLFGYSGTSGSFTNLGTLNISPDPGTTITSINVPVTSSGTINLSSGQLNLENGGNLGGPLAVTAGTQLNFKGGIFTLPSGSTLSGGGTVKVTGATVAVNGTYNLNSSTGTSTFSSGTITFSTSSTAQSLGNTVSIQGATVDLSSSSPSPVNIPTLNITSGTLSGSSAITVTTAFNWSGGTISGTGVMNISGTFDYQVGSLRTLSTRTLNVNSTFTWNGTNILTLSGGGDLTLNNGGTINGPISIGEGSAVAFRTGAFTLSTTSGISGTGTVAFALGGANTAQINATYNLTGAGSGTTFTTGNINFNALATVQSLGQTVSITGATLDLSSGELVSIPSLTLSAGTLTGSDRIDVTSMSWSGGTLSRSGTIDPPNPVNVTNLGISGAGNKVLDTRSMHISGVTTWSSSSTLRLNNSAALTNASGANFTIPSGVVLQVSSNAGPAGTFANAGSLILLGSQAEISVAYTQTGSLNTSSSSTLSLSAGGSLGGTISIPAGSTLNLNGGSFEIPGNLSGSGVVNVTTGTVNVTGTYNLFNDSTSASNFSGGTTTFAATMTAKPALGYTLALSGSANLTLSSGYSNMGVHDLNLSGGVLQGTDSLAILSTMTWSGGRIAGTGSLTLPVAGSLTLSGGGSKTLEGKTLSISGTTSWTGTGSLYLNNNALLYNGDGAVITVQAGGNTSITSSTAGSEGTITNLGQIVTDLSTHTFTLAVGVNNTGLLKVLSGTLIVTGDVTGNGTVAVLSGTLTGSGSISASVLDWSAGTINGSGSLTAAALTFSGTGPRTLNTRTLTITGPFNWTGSGDLSLENSCTLNLNGGGNLTGPAAIAGTGTLSLASTFTVTGTITVQNGITFTWAGGTLSGSGNIDVLDSASSVISGTGPWTLSQVTLNIASPVTWPSTGTLNINNGATLNLSTATPLSLGNLVLSISGGTLTGSADITANTLNWSSGTVNSSVGDPLAVTISTLDLTGTGPWTLAGAHLSVTNTTWPAAGTFTLTDTSILELTGGGTLSSAISVGLGSTLKLAGGSFTVQGQISGAGEVVFDTTSITVASTYNLTGTASRSTFKSGTTTFNSAATVQNLGQTVDLRGATLDLSSGEALSIPTITISAGTLAGSDNINVPGSLTWSGGTIGGTGALTPTAMTISEPGTKTLDGRTLIAGPINWIDNGSLVLVNASTLGLVGGGSLGGSINVGPSSLLRFQSGDFSLNTDVTGGGTVEFTGGNTNVTGTYNLSGTSSASTFTSGLVTFNTVSTAPGLGNTVSILGATLTLSSGQLVPILNLSISGGILTGTDSIQVTGAMDWSGGTISGAAGSLNPSSLNISGASEKRLEGRTLNVTGTVSWSGTGNFTLVNPGKLNLSHNAPVSIPKLNIAGGILDGSDAITITNQLTWSAGTIQGSGTAPGAVTIASAADLQVNGADNKRLYMRPLNVSGTVTWNSTGALRLDSPTAGFNIQAGGSLTVVSSGSYLFTALHGTLTNAGQIIIQNGITTIINVPINLTSTGEIRLPSSSSLKLDYGGILDGLVDVSAGSTLTFGTARPTNSTFTLGPNSIVQGTGAIEFTRPGVTTTVQGIYNISGSTAFNNGVIIFAESSLPQNMGASVSVAGAYVNISSGEEVVISNLSLSAGMLLGSDPITVSNAFTWSGGTLDGVGTVFVANTATLQITGSAPKSLNMRQLNILGITNWTGSGTLALSNGAEVNNQPGAVMTIAQGSEALVMNLTTDNPGFYNFKNAGTLVKLNSNVGKMRVPVHNTGSIQVQQGSMWIEQDYFQTNGELVISAGAELYMNELYNATLTLDGGSLKGDGTLRGNLINAGASIEPGNSLGTLTIEGNYTQQSGGSLLIEAGGTDPLLPESDLLVVTGDANLEHGSLNVALVSAYVPAEDTEFEVLTFQAYRGTPADQIRLIGFPESISLEPVLGASSLKLRVVGAASDLEISLTERQAAAIPGKTITYTIVVTNHGPSPVTNAVVNGTFSDSIESLTWCPAVNGTCSAPGKSAPFETTIDLNASESVTFQVSGTIKAEASGQLVCSVRVTHPTEINPANNEATEIHMLGSETQKLYIPLVTR